MKKAPFCSFTLLWDTIHVCLGSIWPSLSPCMHHNNSNITVWCHYNSVNFLQNPHNRHPPNSSPVRVSYGVSVEILISDSLSATIFAVSYVISWEIRPRYNGTWLYLLVVCWLASLIIVVADVLVPNRTKTSATTMLISVWIKCNLTHWSFE